ncbi:hypothetical protein SAMN05660330_02970 [Desulforhopalus singaporensis]|uniref:Uncharacterized protein n=2 Tax=Desulforhopalus singaporensis TaxID=91360 RepID=A0A1H0T7P4_9BACT|nr:hypothetical protein SAMN05660330_02970 [Desulforhopalus singaporensis]
MQLFLTGLILLVGITTLFWGRARASESSFLDEVKKSTARFDNRSVPLVKEVTEDTVLSHEKYQGGSFRVLARKKNIERYQCSNCHNDKPVTVNRGAELTHGDIVLNHGSAERGLVCIDCHSPEQRDYLEDKKGRKIDFDHSYDLCGQCHFRQKRDWIGGAHGKRVVNWAGDRVVYNCTTCHDPHSPRFEKRFPATYSVPLD